MRKLRRKEAALARQRRQALSQMVPDESKRAEMVELMTSQPALAQLALLRLAYAAFKTGRITDVQARLFGARITKRSTRR